MLQGKRPQKEGGSERETKEPRRPRLPSGQEERSWQKKKKKKIRKWEAVAGEEEGCKVN